MSLLDFIEFDPSEIQAVVQIAEDIIDKNQIIDMENLFKRAKRELQVNTKNLMNIIKYLFQNKIFVEGSRLAKQELLQNAYRSTIYSFVKEFPGVNFVTIKRFAFNKKNRVTESISMSSGQFIWHIGVLLKFKCIKRIDFKKYTLFVIDKMESQLGIYYFLLRDNVNRKIFNYLLNNDSIMQSKIPELTGLSKGSVSHRMNTLKEENIIFSETEGRTFRIRLNPNLKETLIKVCKDIEDKLSKMKIDSGINEILQDKESPKAEKEIREKFEIKPKIESEEKEKISKKKEKQQLEKI